MDESIHAAGAPVRPQAEAKHGRADDARRVPPRPAALTIAWQEQRRCTRSATLSGTNGARLAAGFYASTIRMEVGFAAVCGFLDTCSRRLCAGCSAIRRGRADGRRRDELRRADRAAAADASPVRGRRLRPAEVRPPRPFGEPAGASNRSLRPAAVHRRGHALTSALLMFANLMVSSQSRVTAEVSARDATRTSVRTTPLGAHGSAILEHGANGCPARTFRVALHAQAPAPRRRFGCSDLAACARAVGIGLRMRRAVSRG